MPSDKIKFRQNNSSIKPGAKTMTRTPAKKAVGFDKKDWQLAAGILGLALAVRLVFLYEVSKSPTFFIPIVDSGRYNVLARALASGKPMSSEFFWQAFFYPLFLSWVYLFTAGSIAWAKLIQILLGSGCCVLVYRLALRLFDRRTAVLAGAITALYGPLIFFESQLLATGWASIWAVVLILLFLKVGEKKDPRVYLVLGICGGLSIITRATFLPFFVATGLWMVLALRKTKMKYTAIAVRTGLTAAGTLLIIIPVAVQCFRTTGRFSALPETGAINLYMGNNSDRAEIMAIRPGTDWTNLVLLPRLHGAKNRRQTHQFFIRRVRNYIITEPFHFLKRLARKTVHFFSSREIPSNFDMYASRKYSPLFSILIWKTHGFGFPFAVLLPLTLLGLIRCWRRIPVPIVLFLFFYPLSIILVFVTSRYRTPMIPILAVLAAAGFWNVIETIKMRRWPQVTVMTAAFIAVAALSGIAGPFAAETVNYEAEMYYCLGTRTQRQGRLEESIGYLRKALQLNPEYSDAYNNLGSTLYKQGNFEKAVEYFKKALELNPQYYSAYNNLGTVLGQQGRPKEAIKHFKKALEINPESHATRYNLAIALFNIGEVDQAAKHLREALTCAESAGDHLLATQISKKLESIKTNTD